MLAVLVVIFASSGTSSTVGEELAFVAPGPPGFSCHTCTALRIYSNCRQLKVEIPHRKARRSVRMETSYRCDSTSPAPPNNNDPYQYIDSSIKGILTADPLLPSSPRPRVGEVPLLIDESTLQLHYSKLSEMIDGSSGDGEQSCCTTDEMIGGSSGDGQQSCCTTDELVLLASQCEAALFRHRSSGDLPSILQAHIVEHGILPDQLANLLFITTNPNQKGWEIKTNILLATVLSFNMLESVIRKICDQKAGRAPLLKDMIEKVALMRNESVDDDNTHAIVASILRTLLLPSGINLRNLLWHGFLPEIPRRWLALVVILIMSLEHLDRVFVHSEEPESIETSISPGPDQLVCESVEVELLKKLKILICEEEMSGDFTCGSDSDFYANLISGVSTFVPSTHHHLLKTALCCYAHNRHAICFATIICLVLEHSLRLLWCEENNRPGDRIASIGYQRYYVTLDGIGQINKHDVVLSPYLLSNDKNGNRALASRNHLIDRLGGPTVAFLSDLFCTPNGPNIRSALTHGLLDETLSFELSKMAGGIDCDRKKCSFGISFQPKCQSENLTFALLVSLDLLATSQRSTSKNPTLASKKGPVPVFSYAATFTKNIESVFQVLSAFDASVGGIATMPTLNSRHEHALSALSVADIDIDRLRSILEGAQPCYDYHSTSSWSVDDVFRESNYNVILADCRASCALIENVLEALKDFSHARRDAAENLLKHQDSSSQTFGHEGKQFGGKRDDGDISYSKTRAVAAEILLDKNKKRLSPEVKKAARVFSIETLALAMYRAAIFAALMHIKSRAEEQKGGKVADEIFLPDSTTLLKAVERSRMCVSTFNTFLDTNIERSIKAAADYTLGKAMKTILSL